MICKFRKYSLLACLLLVTAVSCFRDDHFNENTGGASSSGRRISEDTRSIPEYKRHVVLMVAGGRNNLSSYIRSDMGNLATSPLPGDFLSDPVLLVLSRLNGPGMTSSDPNPAILYRLYTDHGGIVHKDTVKTWEGFAPLFGDNTLREALRYIQDNYPAGNYGMVLSSHGSGWLPSGYYNKPAEYEHLHPVPSAAGALRSVRRTAAEEEFPPIPAWPPVKSIGQDVDNGVSVEMELADFCSAIPSQMEYILLDACLNGGVEVAWALREKTKLVGFSPTEVLAYGFDYTKLADRLCRMTPEPETVCRDYIAQYKEDSSMPWATISLVDTREMTPLATLCKTLFEKYRTQLRSLDGALVQRYYRYNRHFYYDLKDILVKAGITAEEEAALDAALARCVVYKENTEWFFTPQDDGFQLQNCCGMSMYLPSMGTAVLDYFYKQNVGWNQATELVK